MDYSEPTNQPQPEQEIDLVDLVAILWLHKPAIISVSVLSVLAGMFFLTDNNNDVHVSVSSTVGELAVIRDGNEVVEKIMNFSESRALLKEVIIPAEIAAGAQGDTDLYLMFATNTKVVESPTVIETGIITISGTFSENYSELAVDIFEASVHQLLVRQNRVYERQEDWVNNQIAIIKLELKNQQDSRRVEESMLSLKSSEFANMVALDKTTNEELIKQQVANQQAMIDSAETNLFSLKQSLILQNLALKRLVDLIPVLESRMRKAQDELVKVEEARARLIEQLGSKGSSSALVMEAMLAIDGRDFRYRNQIENINEQLLVDFPQQRVKLEIRLKSLKEEIILAETSVDTAVHALAIYHIHSEYEQKELEHKSKSINIRLDGTNAAREVEKQQLEASIKTLELSLRKSTPSKLLSTIKAPTERGKGYLFIVGSSSFVGAVFGCFLVLLLNLISKARIRIANSTG
jgi:hypothetical protein